MERKLLMTMLLRLKNLAVSGNVKMNDTDPEGNIQSVVPQNTTINGVGTLVLGPTGNYTFTPVAGFRGPVNFKYNVCDNGIPSACAEATLYILVGPFDPDPDTYEIPWRVTLTASIVANDTVPLGTTYGTPIPLAGNPPLSSIVMQPNGTFEFKNRRVGTYLYNVPVCPAGQATNCPLELLTINVIDTCKIQPACRDINVFLNPENCKAELLETGVMGPMCTS